MQKWRSSKYPSWWRKTAQQWPNQGPNQGKDKCSVDKRRCPHERCPSLWIHALLCEILQLDWNGKAEKIIVELHRAYTLRVLCICAAWRAAVDTHLTISTRQVVHSGHSQWVWLWWPAKDAISDTHGPCQTIQRTFKQVFHQFWFTHYAHELLRCLDVEIWRF